MTFLNSIGIAKKLPAIIAVLCTTVAVAVSVTGYLDFRRTILVETQHALSILTKERRAALEYWSKEITEAVGLYGINPTVVEATAAFDSTFALLSDDPVADRQRAYITGNPFPAGEKEKLDRADENVPYNFQHASYHPFFRNLNTAGGYYDVFLFNTEGDLIYSVYKELDYATNFVTGPYASSGLAEVFKNALSLAPGEIAASDFQPYAPSADAPASFMATPVVRDDGTVIGVYAIQVPADHISEIIANPSGLGEQGELYALGSDFHTRSASRFEDRFDLLETVPVTPHVTEAFEAETAFFPEAIGVSGDPVIAMSLPLQVLGQEWRMIGEFATEEVMAPAVAVRNKMVVVTLVGAIAAVVFGWLTAQSVTKPLDRLGKAMRAVSHKEFGTKIQDTDRGDEIGGLANVLVGFRDSLQTADAQDAERHRLQQDQMRMVEVLSVALKRLASGDLTQPIQSAFPDGYEGLRADYNQSVENLNKAIGAVVSSSQQIRTGLGKMSDASDELSRRTENQAATLEQTAAALDEMTTSVKSAASGAKEVEQSVVSAQSDAADSRPVVDNAVAAMTEIEKSSEEISQIISVIDDIAFQTNLLALNAGVEAARAGDAGRGFAVVASEVRALAKRSSDAAKQIKDLIDGSSDQVQRGVSLVGEAGGAVAKIVEHIDRISGLMTEIVASAEEQSTGLGEINIGVTQLDKVTQENAGMVEESASNSHALNQEARRLAELMGQFSLKDGYSITAEKPSAKANVMTFKPARAEATPPAKKPTAQPSSTPAATGTDGNAIWEDF